VIAGDELARALGFGVVAVLVVLGGVIGWAIVMLAGQRLARWRRRWVVAGDVGDRVAQHRGKVDRHGVASGDAVGSSSTTDVAGDNGRRVEGLDVEVLELGEHSI
jgi:hypothetical protein